MTKLSNLLKTLSFPVLDTIFSFLGIFLFRVFTMRHTSLKEYGIYVILITISTFAILFSTTLTDKSFTHYYAKTKDINYFFSSLFFQIITFIFSTILLFILKDFIADIFQTEFNSNLILLIPIFMIGQIFINITKNLFEAVQNFKFSFFISFINVIVLNIIMAIFYIKSNFNAKTLFEINIINNSILLIVSILFFMPIIKHEIPNINKNKIKNNLKDLINYGKYSLGLSFSFMFYTQADTVIIGMLMPSKYIALYDAPKKLLPAIRMFSNTISKVLFPKISATNNKKIQRDLYYKYLKLGILGSITFALILFIFSKQIMLLVFGERFISSFIILQIFSIYFLLHPILNISGATLGALNRPDKDFQTLFISMIVNIILDLILIPKFDLIGASLATIIAIALATTMNFNKVRKIFK